MGFKGILSLMIGTTALLAATSGYAEGAENSVYLEVKKRYNSASVPSDSQLRLDKTWSCEQFHPDMGRTSKSELQFKKKDFIYENLLGFFAEIFVRANNNLIGEKKVNDKYNVYDVYEVRLAAPDRLVIKNLNSFVGTYYTIETTTYHYCSPKESKASSKPTSSPVSSAAPSTILQEEQRLNDIARDFQYSSYNYMPDWAKESDAFKKYREDFIASSVPSQYDLQPGKSWKCSRIGVNPHLPGYVSHDPTLFETFNFSIKGDVAYDKLKSFEFYANDTKGKFIKTNAGYQTYDHLRSHDGARSVYEVKTVRVRSNGDLVIETSDGARTYEKPYYIPAVVNNVSGQAQGVKLYYHCPRHQAEAGKTSLDQTKPKPVSSPAPKKSHPQTPEILKLDSTGILPEI